MMENDKKLTTKHYLLIASMLFGMFFGAGNLIFPIHLGQPVPFQIGIGNYISSNQTSLYLLIYSIAFFGITYWASRKPTGIIDSIGKLLNPAFLILLAIMFGFAFTRPMGTASKMATAGPTYSNGPS